ncbi:MAG: phosphoheptose isomerase [Cyclobacteriaceae bacterium]|nr:MAG: phosphoheptose isomerase [Cyclobacteriaceae bacterium]
MLTIEPKASRTQVFETIAHYLKAEGFTVADQDFNRPWGGFFVLDEKDAPAFAAKYFQEEDLATLKIAGKLSPKILIVAEQKRLSWQYHFRRAEIWKLIAGTAGVMISDTDEQGSVKRLSIGEIVRLPKGQRHRLVGLDGWGIVAEIWQHTDAANPSDENDIVRLQDDFGR